MFAKMTAKNQLTLPKTVTDAVGATDYFDVETLSALVFGAGTPGALRHATSTRKPATRLRGGKRSLRTASCKAGPRSRGWRGRMGWRSPHK